MTPYPFLQKGSPMRPTIGRIVLYTLSAEDAVAITRHRAALVGAEGNRVEEGQVFPAMVVRVWGDAPEASVQLQVFLDGNDAHWATSVKEGEGPRTWAWPPRD